MYYAKNFLKMDKIDRLLDAMEHPESYTSTEIGSMLQDPEVKEVFDLLDKMKSGLQPVATPDIEDEWKRFECAHCSLPVSRQTWLTRLLSRNVAAGIVIGIVSFTAVAAIVGVGIHQLNNRAGNTHEVENMALVDICVPQQDTIAALKKEKPAPVETVVFNNETLETILSEIATHYGYNVIFNSEASKPLRLYFRWDKTLAINEVIARLNNFEQIHIRIKDTCIEAD